MRAAVTILRGRLNTQQVVRRALFEDPVECELAAALNDRVKSAASRTGDVAQRPRENRAVARHLTLSWRPSSRRRHLLGTQSIEVEHVDRAVGFSRALTDEPADISEVRTSAHAIGLQNPGADEHDGLSLRVRTQRSKQPLKATQPLRDLHLREL